MVVSIPQIIAAVVPERYNDMDCEHDVECKAKLKEFKEFIEEEGIYAAASQTNPKPIATHKLVYDSPTETLEPIYFFILDLMNDFGLKPEKLEDNFASSPGSQHFGEMGQRSSIMQQQGSKLMGDINMVLRSVLNLIYDLREFKIRLQSYDDLADSEKTEGALLSLKQIWMDKVDIAKGNSSIKAMALGQGGFTTLIDAFLASKTENDIDNLDLNQVVKRILKPRLHEFDTWLKHSEGELRKRYEIEKTYLKSQVNSLKIYSRWAKPYMKAAQELEMQDMGRDPAMVKMFNSLILEVTLLGKHNLDIDENVNEGNFPEYFSNSKFKKSLTDTYHPCTLINFKFRGIPNRTQQGYVVGGRAEVTFMSYALKGSEIKKINEVIDKSDVNSAFELVEGTTTDSLGQLQEDIDYFLEEIKEDEQAKAVSNDKSNPFLALIGYYDRQGVKKKTQKKTIKVEPKASKEKIKWFEKDYFMDAISKSAEETTFTIFDIYKKAHKMASFPKLL